MPASSSIGPWVVVSMSSISTYVQLGELPSVPEEPPSAPGVPASVTGKPPSAPGEPSCVPRRPAGWPRPPSGPRSPANCLHRRRTIDRTARTASNPPKGGQREKGKH